MRRSLAVIGFGTFMAGMLIAAPSAQAARPRCHIVADRTGDATNLPGTGQAELPNQDDLDITSGDLATSRRFLTTVVRVKDLAYVLSPAPRVRQYLLYFHIGKTHYATSATHYPDGDSFLLIGGAAGEGNTRVDPVGLGSNFKVVSGVFDQAHSEVRVTVPLGQFHIDGPVTPGHKITEISAATYQGLGSSTAIGGYVGGQEDRTDSPDGQYVIDSPSCVTPGR